MDVIRKLTGEEALTIGVDLSDDQLTQFARYHKFMVAENRKYNLTGICTPEEIVTKHFIDSLLCAKLDLIKGKESLIDVGSGAGLPGIPLKILYPELKLVLLEATKKKASFLEETIGLLEMDDAVVINDRAENVGRTGGYRESFDLAVSRAVAALPVLLEYCLPLVSTGGYFLALKGPGLEEEIDAATGAAKVLGGKLIGIHDFVLPHDKGNRKIAAYRKVNSSELKYPRRPGIPAKRPLK